MLVEEYVKSRGGRKYYAVYCRYGKVEVSVADIEADSKENALKKAVKYLSNALKEAQE